MGRQGSQSKSPADLLRQAFKTAVQPGKQALERADRPKVETDGLSTLECSLHLDKCLQQELPNSRRWDYILVIRGSQAQAMAVEVHPATASEVKAILEKQEWAIQVLRKRCPALRIENSDWHWVASGKVYLRPTDPQFRRLKQSGIKGPVERVTLSAR